MVDMACWDSLERVFHEEFKYGIVRVIHWGPEISVLGSEGVKMHTYFTLERHGINPFTAGPEIFGTQ